MPRFSELQAPQVHSNGTSPDHLVGALGAAMNALEAAHDAVKATAPHPRDYDPRGYARARAQHADRIRTIEEVKDELGDLVALIDAQAHLQPSRF